MRQKLFAGSILALALSMSGAAEYVAKTTVTGTTAASVTFAGKGGVALRLLSVDGTSDKAASLFTWRAGAGQSATLLAAAASTATNLTTTPSTMVSNDIVLLQNAAGSVVQGSVWTNVAATNQLLVFGNVLGTNLAAGDALYEATNSSTLIFSGAVMAATNLSLHIVAQPQLEAGNTVVISSGTSAVIKVIDSITTTNLTLTTAVGIALTGGDVVTKLLSRGTALLPSAATEYTITAAAATGLTLGDSVIIAPATGGVFTNSYRAAEARPMNTLTLLAATGITMSAGDGVFVTTTNTSPVGAASLRLSGPAVFLSPPGRPAILTLDGTSAVKLNVVNGIYD